MLNRIHADSAISALNLFHTMLSDNSGQINMAVDGMNNNIDFNLSPTITSTHVLIYKIALLIGSSKKNIEADEFGHLPQLINGILIRFNPFSPSSIGISARTNAELVMQSTSSEFIAIDGKAAIKADWVFPQLYQQPVLIRTSEVGVVVRDDLTNVGVLRASIFGKTINLEQGS